MTAIPMPAAFSMGTVISRLFAVLGRNLTTLLLLSVLLVGAPTAVVSFAQLGVFSANALNFFAPVRLGLGALGFLISIVCNAVLQAAVIHATVGDLAGRKVSFGESLGVGFRFFLPLIGISIIAWVGCTLGFILFIVPGVLLALAWCVAAPAAVMEGVGVFGALGRSLDLTRNHRGAIFGLMLAYIVVTWIVQMVLGSIAAVSVASSAGAMRAAPGQLPQGFQTLMWVQTGFALVINTLLASVSSVGIASIYFELRQSKEGIGVEQLASVFD
ncbi:MAG TPA: hypothetical protein VGG29_19425 [Caulobacteraceae bacterium]|jgi:hypothetical protein